MILDDFRLDERVAIVTGAGRGIGEGIAHGLAEVGARVVCAARTEGEIDAVAGAIRERGGDAVAIACDVTDASQREALVAETQKQLGGIDILVNNAGGGGWGDTLKLDDDLLLQTLQLNFLAAVHLSRLAIPVMRDASDGGAIVNISSGMARVLDVGALPYGSAKAALEHATRAMAFEFAPEVRINAIRCGAILTPDIENLFARSDEIRPGLEAWTPLKRIGTPRDVALAALYLASPASSFVTGKILDVDGGTIEERSTLAIMRGPH